MFECCSHFYAHVMVRAVAHVLVWTSPIRSPFKHRTRNNSPSYCGLFCFLHIALALHSVSEHHLAVMSACVELHVMSRHVMLLCSALMLVLGRRHDVSRAHSENTQYNW